MFRVVLNRDNLEKAMLRRNLSCKLLAGKIGLSPSYLSRIITGKQNPTASVRQTLLDYFKTYSFDDLFTIQENGVGERN
ncbi:Helix-turn-helix domain-containing protein [Dehalogenimonas formicexedens]|uniref:Helix-turn-helix domain-containing protein n=1 Tax=Dehalogenimonas formicexedens TaxID=1839801 RepID=A0A1P8F581_9CHLR|nr:helix-turn-helix transcriptional regulator [Dehalogenimonas formicexedens]APV43623.1 Helix-turn-helix domain-containing protein [Dehalogenimonas formicexedens]